MRLRNFLLRPLPPLAALGVTGAVLFLALALLLSLAERERSAAHFLRADTLELFVQETSGQASEEPLSLLFPEISSLRLPPEVLPYLQGESVRAEFRTNGVRQRVEFHRLKPGATSYRKAKVVAEKFSPCATIRGVYFVWSDQDAGNVLQPPSGGGTLAQDVRFRSMRQALGPSAPFFLYMRHSSTGQFPLALPLFLQHLAKDAQEIGVAAERDQGQFRLSVSLPDPGPSSDTSSSPLSLSSQIENQPEPLLFGAEGRDMHAESEALVALLADGNDERKLLLRGVLAASVKNAFGTIVLPAHPYTFLARHGSGAAFPWVLALERSAEADTFRQSLEEAFLSHASRAKVRERILPGEITVRDVLLNPDPSKSAFASATQGTTLLMSNSEKFLKDTIDAPSTMPGARVTHGVALDRGAFGALQTLLLPSESAFFSSLAEFVGDSQSFSWVRAPAGGFVRHLFLLKL